MLGSISPVGLGFGVSAEIPEVPDAPVISTVVDDLNEDSITVTVTGSGTIQLYYRQKGTASWTTGLTRIGDGDIVQTGLTAGRFYEIYATQKYGDLESPPSAIFSIKVLEGDDTTIETAIYSILTADENILSLVSTKIYPKIMPQSASLPAITYNQISGPRGHTMGGPDGTVKARYQIDCWASTYSGAKALAEAVRKELDGYTGTVNSREIESIMLDNEGDIPSGEENINNIRLFGKMLDFIIFYKE